MSNARISMLPGNRGHNSNLEVGRDSDGDIDVVVGSKKVDGFETLF
jgi:hypothetical protein